MFSSVHGHTLEFGPEGEASRGPSRDHRVRMVESDCAYAQAKVLRILRAAVHPGQQRCQQTAIPVPVQ